MDVLRVAGAQINPTVGDLAGNEARILDAMRRAEDAAADVLLLPELAVCGYPPEDLLLRRSFIAENQRVLERLAAASGRTAVVVGFVDTVGDADASQRRRHDDSVHRRIANSAAVLAGGEVKGVYHKVLLPNYGVFDEARYFVPGAGAGDLYAVAGIPCGVSVCEDIWTDDGPPSLQAQGGARILLNINGSPYHRGKPGERAKLLADAAARCDTPVVYLNLVGGQDELVFDGDSMVFSADGDVIYRAAQFSEELFVVDVPLADSGSRAPALPVVRVTDSPGEERPVLQVPPSRPRMVEEEEVYTALTVGLGDYVEKNGFPGIVVGLSGGIDSALTAAIAVDALGSDAVWGVTMPARYSSEGSVADSADLAARLGCRFDTIQIDDVFAGFLEALAPTFSGTDEGVAEENLQARIRGAILMALSNKFGGMVVATGNKSEMAVGYATLYGDMAGGYAVLKDVFKTLVYRLAEWRNRDGEVIPRSIIDKAPSAELRPDQKDSDSLPPYPVLDEILRRYVEGDESAESIIADGSDAAVVRRVARMVDRNEYKRRQAAPGVKITEKAFGKDRRLPITNGYPA
jgi:NAD+ synthase (glutamine-hydrolysing)